MTKKVILYVAILLCTLGFSFVETIDAYAIRAVGKIALGILIPCIVAVINKETKIKEFLKFRKEGFKRGVTFALLTFGGILIYFFATKNIINYSGTITTIMDLTGGSIVKILLIDFYIIFVNAFVEEFFFRGFVYRNIKNEKCATFVSAVLFAMYHTLLLFKMFDLIIGTAALISLYIVGIIFIKLNEKSNNIYPSWLVHMSANLALNICGLILMLESGLMNI